MNINVTKPFMPDYEAYASLAKGIWKRGWLTNNGPLLNDFEIKLKEYLKIDHLLYVTNGTIALQLAIKALGVTGEVITTPYGFVGTASSIVWENCRPVMVDIDAETLNIDPRKIEAAITARTKAIVAAHVYGNPCDVNAIEEIANHHQIPVIYDAAHAFGSTIDGRSILARGDVSTTSFDMTKLFHTIEGGAVFTPKSEVLRQLALMRNFGLANAETIETVGINGKNCEFHAAMGLANLPRIDEILARRKDLAKHYDSRLTGAPLRRPRVATECDCNFAYYPVIFDDEDVLLKVIDELHLHKVASRRYFYPPLSTLDYVGKQSTPIAENLSRRVLGLPMFHDLSFAEIDMIARTILRTCRYHGRRPWVSLHSLHRPPSPAPQ